MLFKVSSNSNRRRVLMNVFLATSMLLAFFPLVNCQKTFAQTSGNNDWSTASNWAPPGIPTSDDDVIIPYSPGEYTVSISSGAQCRSLKIGGPSTLANEVQWDPANTQTLAILSGTLSISGNCTVLQSGILSVAGTGITGLSASGTSINVKGGVEFSTGTHTLSALSLVIDNAGYMNVIDEPNGLILSDAASLIILTGGNVTLASQAGIINTDNTAVSVINYGDFYCVPASVDNFVTKVAAPFFNYGFVYVLSGTVSFDHNGTWHGTLDINGASFYITSGTHQFFGDSTIKGQGTLQVQNDASVTLQGTVSISNFVLALGGASVHVDNLSVTTQFGNFLMLGGTLTGSSSEIQTLTWAGGDITMTSISINILQISGDFTASITSTPMTVKQQATFQNTTHLLLFHSTFTLAEGAIMTFDKEVYFICNKTDTISALQIGGTMQITYPETTTLTCALNVLRNGIVSAVAGLLDIQTPVNCNGVIDISSSAVVALETYGTFFPESTIRGSGTLDCQSCNIQVFGSVDIGTLNFPAGNMTFQSDGGVSGYFPSVQFFNQSGSSSMYIINNSPSDLNFTISNMNFAGGAIISNQNSKLNLVANLIVTNSSSFYGVTPYLFTNIAFINSGATTFHGNGAMKFWQNAIIYNSPSGTITVAGSLTASQNDLLGFQSQIQNYGHFEVLDGSTATLALDFHNMGSASLIVTGQLFITSGFFTQEDNSVTTLNLGGSLELANPGLFLGGVLKGKGTIDGAVTLDGATIVVNNDSSLTITSVFLQRGNGVLEVDVASSSELQVQSLAQISGGGLVIYSSTGNAPATKQFVSARSIVGRGVDNIFNASLNSTSGFSYVNNTGALIAVVTSLPQISAVTPSSGSAGTTVTITGSNFVYGETYWNISVLFGTVAVPAVLATRLTLIVTAPVGSGSGIPIVVVADGRMSNQVSWSYSLPIIQSILPEFGPTAGSNLVTITGNNFGFDASVVQIPFGPSLCAITQISNEQIICIAPQGLGANISVAVEVKQQRSNILQYSYSAPVLQSVYPSAIVVDEPIGPITVVGENLAYVGLQQTNVTVTIGDYLCTNTNQTSLTTVTCLPPSQLLDSGVGAYPVKVLVDGQVSKNLTFKVVSTHSPKPTSTKLWPLPWWLLVSAGAALVVLFVIGLVVGCVTGRKRATTALYEPVPTAIN